MRWATAPTSAGRCLAGSRRSACSSALAWLRWASLFTGWAAASPSPGSRTANGPRAFCPGIETGQVGCSVWRNGGIRVARIGGIAVDIHLSFALVIAWGAWQGWARYGSVEGAAFGILAVLLLFGCVLLHELGHGLQARALGLAVHRITLLPIGGLAELESSPSYYRHELFIALAGPVVNLGLALLLGVIAYLIQPFSLASWPDYLLFLAPQSGRTLLLYTFWVNALLFFSNMLPAFPMDGGRVMRAALAILTDYETGTRLTAWLGRLVAVGIILWVGHGLL